MAQRDQTLDAFRGIAIIMVVLYHFNSRLPAYALNAATPMPLPLDFGWIGVYFFFIISGYCIFLTLGRSTSVPSFLAKRFSRIYPAFAASILCLLAFHAVFYVPSVPEASYHVRDANGVDVILNLVFLGEIGEWVNGSFWSIAVEVKFYLLIGLFALVQRDMSTLALRFGQLSVVMAIIWFISLPFSPPEQDPFTAQSMLKFLAIAPYLCSFSIGILAWQAAQDRLAQHRPWLLANFVLAVAVIVVQSLRYEGEANQWSALAGGLTFVVLTAAFLWFAAGHRIPRVPVLTPLLASIGLISFSWYLTHEMIGMSLLANFNLVLPPAASLAIAILGTLCFAVLFSLAFEWRFRKPVERLSLSLLEGIGRLAQPRQP